MQSKTKSIVLIVVFVALVIGVWAGGPALYRMFLAMHGIHR